MYSTILVVDDSATSRMIIKKCFQMAGLEESSFLEAEDGLKAAAMLQDQKVDLILTDLKMPGINGLTLASVARSLHPTIGVILMTAYGSREVEAEAEQLMIDGYLTKPFQMERLRDLVEKILQAQQHPAS